MLVRCVFPQELSAFLRVLVLVKVLYDMRFSLVLHLLQLAHYQLGVR